MKHLFQILLILSIFLCFSALYAQTTVSYTSPTTTTWTVPSCVTSITVQVWGAGGGGGGAIAIVKNSTGDEACSGAGGGGGGGYTSITIPVTPGQVFNVVVAEAQVEMELGAVVFLPLLQLVE